MELINSLTLINRNILGWKSPWGIIQSNSLLKAVSSEMTPRCSVAQVRLSLSSPISTVSMTTFKRHRLYLSAPVPVANCSHREKFLFISSHISILCLSESLLPLVLHASLRRSQFNFDDRHSIITANKPCFLTLLSRGKCSSPQSTLALCWTCSSQPQCFLYWWDPNWTQ